MSRLLLGSAWLAITLALPAIANGQNGEFTGVITDPSGAVVEQARIWIRNLETGYGVELCSNFDGVYRGRELIVGQYEIKVQVPGFRTATSGTLSLNAGTVVRADFRLQIGP